MKKLILIRHGKSSWEKPLEDVERPLKERGYEDAEIIISAFKHYFEKPVKAYTSKAVRAATTAKLFKKGLEIDDADFEVVDDLYTFDYERILDFIRSQDDSIDQLMLFGHNPAFTALANELGDQGINNVPTTGLVVIDFQVDSWQDVDYGKTLLTLFPKNFK